MEAGKDHLGLVRSNVGDLSDFERKKDRNEAEACLRAFKEVYLHACGAQFLLEIPFLVPIKQQHVSLKPMRSRCARDALASFVRRTGLGAHLVSLGPRGEETLLGRHATTSQRRSDDAEGGAGGRMKKGCFFRRCWV